MNLPIDDGYSVADGLAHTRFPKHATIESPRRARSQKAVVALLGPNPKVCRACYQVVEKKRVTRSPVSRPSRPTVPENRSASGPSLSDMSDRVGTTPRFQQPARVRSQAPETPLTDDQPDHAL